MKSKVVLSMLGLLLIAASLSAFTSFTKEKEKNPVKTEVAPDDTVQVFTVTFSNTGERKFIFFDTKDRKEQVIIASIRKIKSRAASECNCEMAVVDAEQGTCVTTCYVGGASEFSVSEQHDCCNQPMYPCQ